MKKQNSYNKEIIKMTKEITEKAKERNLIKPLSESFEDVPVRKEIHKGNINYFN